MATTNTTIQLDGKSAVLTWSNVAVARLQSLKGGAPSPKDFQKPSKALYAICAWTWAMLPKDVRGDYAEPEDVANDITPETMSQVVDAITNAITESLPNPKKSPSPTRGSK